MKNNINFDRYIELLKKKESLQNEGRSLFEENREEDLELLSYGIILENQIYYTNKDDYIFLVEEYLRENAGEAGARLFVWEFFTIFQKDNKTLEIFKKEILQQGIQKLATFRIDPKSTEFTPLVHQIHDYSEVLTFNLKTLYRITLDQFNNSIQKIYLKIQNFLNED